VNKDYQKITAAIRFPASTFYLDFIETKTLFWSQRWLRCHFVFSVHHCVLFSL